MTKGDFGGPRSNFFFLVFNGQDMSEGSTILFLN